MHENDLIYYSVREQQERKAASTAMDPAAQDIHLALAERYADALWSLREGGNPRIPTRLGR